MRSSMNRTCSSLVKFSPISTETLCKTFKNSSKLREISPTSPRRVFLLCPNCWKRQQSLDLETKVGKTSKSQSRWVRWSKLSSGFFDEQCMKIRSNCFSIWQKMFNASRAPSPSLPCSLLSLVEQEEEATSCCRELSIRYSQSPSKEIFSSLEVKTSNCRKCGNSILPEGEDLHSSATFRSSHDCQIGEKMLMLWKYFLILMLLRVLELATSPCRHKASKMAFNSLMLTPFSPCSIRSRTVPRSSFRSLLALKNDVHRSCWCFAVFGTTLSRLSLPLSRYRLLCILACSVVRRCETSLLKKETITAVSLRVLSTIFLKPADNSICCMINSTFSSCPRSSVSTRRQQTSAMQTSNRLKSSTSYLVGFCLVLSRWKKIRQVRALYTSLGLISNSLRKRWTRSKVCSGLFWCMAVFSMYLAQAFRRGVLSSKSNELCSTLSASIAKTSAPKSLLCRMSRQRRSRCCRRKVSKASLRFLCGKASSGWWAGYVRYWGGVLETAAA